MSISGTIMSKIFGASKTPAAPASASRSTGAAAPAPPAPAAGATPAAPAGSVDVAAILDGLNEKHPEELDWRKSIVDLMKLVGLDSSLTARKQLAAELNYKGDQRFRVNEYLAAQADDGEDRRKRRKTASRPCALRRAQDLTSKTGPWRFSPRAFCATVISSAGQSFLADLFPRQSAKRGTRPPERAEGRTASSNPTPTLDLLHNRHATLSSML
jgi:Domain of unknown function (DUF3597)